MAQRRLIHLVLAALIALVGVSASTPVGATGGPTIERYDTVIPVAWEMTPARCGRLQATTRGTGSMREQTMIKHNADGSIDVIVSDVVSGTAIDDNGISYGWNYKNHQRTTIPAAPHNDRVSIHMSDLFTLNGGGSAGTAPFTIGLVWSWDYTNAGDLPPFTGQWPPENNLVKHATIGDFTATPTGLDCDPV